ncbi:hypothetical protein A0H81_05538 [Grifola frondosa]|uniref:Nudix hydrolase domain-containing protein n=1 Tax=Grifola frondosa TaxID=5627 RepID=A0A1C7MBW7_GRIFR|nr:hypothetical protein A0H81_05538 [Grifola frondosa]
MVIIQPSTGKVVLLRVPEHDFNPKEPRYIWFLPKGRKDVGETLEQTALRQAYEESGFRVQFLPLFTKNNASSPPGSSHRHVDLPSTEPIFVTTMACDSHKKGASKRGKVEYLSFWYVGEISNNAVVERNVTLPDGRNSWHMSAGSIRGSD